MIFCGRGGIRTHLLSANTPICYETDFTDRRRYPPIISMNIAGVAGIEPTSTVLETGMLPLHHTPIFVGTERFELSLLLYQSSILTPFRWCPGIFQTTFGVVPVGFEPTSSHFKRVVHQPFCHETICFKELFVLPTRLELVTGFRLPHWLKVSCATNCATRAFQKPLWLA